MRNVLFSLLFAAVAHAATPTLVPEPDRQVHDTIGGHSRAFTIQSAILGQTRRVFIHLPRSFDHSAASRKYPVLVLFDGEWLLRPVVAVSEVLAGDGQMPEVVLVSIENTDDFRGRVHDLTPPGLSVSGSSINEGGDRFLDFIEKELFPALDAGFRTTAPRGLVGTSSGGVLATYAAATRPSFAVVLALDTPMHLGDAWLEKKMMQRPPNIPLHYASIESRFGWSDAAWARFAAAAPKSWTVYREHLQHEMHTSMQFVGAYIGLRELFHDYSMLSAPEYPTTSILPSYAKLTAAYGAPLIPPQALLRNVVDDLLMEGRGAEARSAYETLARSYGPPSDAVGLEREIARVEKQPAPAETVEGLLATPFPTPEEARDYIGEWEGEEWVEGTGDPHHRMLLRIAVEHGAVVGTAISFPEPTVELPMKLQVLRVTPRGLDFGYMNGMRPRGVILHEARRSGDVLEGEDRFGGINFTPPDGMPIPKRRFVLRKKAAAPR